MARMSPQEQLMLELTNRARMDPEGEARRYGIALNEGLSGSTISSQSKQVLAGNDLIATAADKHGSWMLRNDIFAHEQSAGTAGFTGTNAKDRMENAGYNFTGNSTWGENISWRGTTQSISAAMQTQYILQQHEDLFVDSGISGRGHRRNILSEDFTEVGISQQIGKFTSGGNTYNSSMVTQDFATSGDTVFVTGVIYMDTVVQDDFFSVGEQMANRKIRSTGADNDTSGAGGGYELAYTKVGSKSIDFDLGNSSLRVGLELGSDNVKLDVVNRREVWSNADITSVSSNVRQLHALGIDDVDLTGGRGTQTIFGNDAGNVLRGKGGSDKLEGGGGKDQLFGGTGADTFVFARGDTARTHAKADLIGDFNIGDGDVIDLHRWDANAGKTGNQAFSFIGTEDFHGKAGEMHVIEEKSSTWIEGDTNGDGNADFALHLKGRIDLDAGHFIL